MISIVIISSDGYEDCWDPFFKLFERNFENINDYELILSTNTKSYKHENLKIKTLQNGLDTAWSKRVQMSLEQCTYPIVMVMVEDFFLLSKFNGECFKQFIDLITNKPEVGHIRLLYNQEKIKTIPTENPLIDRIPSISKHRFLLLPGLWKKDVLCKYLVDFETPHIAEKMGNFRSWMRNDGFYCVSQKFLKENGRFYDCATSGAIIKGKWGKWLPERLKENEIKIDFKKRGFKTGESQKKAKLEVQLGMLKNPISTMKSLIYTLKLLFIK